MAILHSNKQNYIKIVNNSVIAKDDYLTINIYNSSSDRDNEKKYGLKGIKTLENLRAMVDDFYNQIFFAMDILLSGIGKNIDTATIEEITSFNNNELSGLIKDTEEVQQELMLLEEFLADTKNKEIKLERILPYLVIELKEEILEIKNNLDIALSDEDISIEILKSAFPIKATVTMFVANAKAEETLEYNYDALVKSNSIPGGGFC